MGKASRSKGTNLGRTLHPKRKPTATEPRIGICRRCGVYGITTEGRCSESIVKMLKCQRRFERMA